MQRGDEWVVNGCEVGCEVGGVFWPQYLEWLGLGLLVVLALWGGWRVVRGTRKRD
jgi:hypothetical protein